MNRQSIHEVFAQHAGRLMALPGVTAVTEGEMGGEPCIRVYVVDLDPELERRIPRDLGGYPVAVQVTGKIRVVPEGPEG